jgi:hypothetical protein
MGLFQTTTARAASPALGQRAHSGWRTRRVARRRGGGSYRPDPQGSAGIDSFVGECYADPPADRHHPASHGNAGAQSAGERVDASHAPGEGENGLPLLRDGAAKLLVYECRQGRVEPFAGGSIQDAEAGVRVQQPHLGRGVVDHIPVIESHDGLFKIGVGQRALPPVAVPRQPLLPEVSARDGTYCRITSRAAARKRSSGDDSCVGLASRPRRSRELPRSASDPPGLSARATFGNPTSSSIQCRAEAESARSKAASGRR